MVGCHCLTLAEVRCARQCLAQLNLLGHNRWLQMFRQGTNNDCIGRARVLPLAQTAMLRHSAAGGQEPPAGLQTQPHR